jgi:hypothetical protein
MSANVQAGGRIRQVRLYLGLFFASFLILSAVVTVVAVVDGLKADVPHMLLPADTPPAARLLLFVIGLGISWYAGRMLFRFLMRGELPVGDATNIAYVMLFYLLQLFAAVAFLGVLYWFLFPFFFLVLLIISVIALWEILGGLFTACSVALALVAAFATFYLLS